MNQPPARHRHKPPQHGGSYRPRSPAQRRPDAVFIYGLHAVVAALGNPRRVATRLLATPNALTRLRGDGAILPATIEEVTPRDLDRLLGTEAVHQGVALEASPLEPLDIDALADFRLIVVLDQVTDPHNVGAILRSALAFSADALVTTGRHSPVESGVLAKAASGALDQMPIVEVTNLARALGEIGDLGFTRVGLDSDAEAPLDRGISGDRIALVLGAEGHGLRRLTRENCDVLARLPTTGSLATLNVSNAAVLALYLARRHLDATAPTA